MKFNNDISGNFFVYDKNWPSYDFLKIEKKNEQPFPFRVKSCPG